MREATVEREAIVYTINYEAMDQGGSTRRGKRAGDHLQLAQVVDARVSLHSDELNKASGQG